MGIVFTNVCDMFWILLCLEVPVLDENRPKTERWSTLYPYKQFGVERKWRLQAAGNNRGTRWDDIKSTIHKLSKENIGMNAYGHP